MLIDVECPRCNGMGEVSGSTPNVRARYVRHDDLSPDDYAEQCPKCAGSGTVDYDPEDEIEDWMKETKQMTGKTITGTPGLDSIIGTDGNEADALRDLLNREVLKGEG